MTMPGRRLERVTGSNINPVTRPPSGLSYEILLTSTPLLVDSTVFCRFSGALTLYANRLRSASVATLKLGRAIAQESSTAVNVPSEAPAQAGRIANATAITGVIVIVLMRSRQVEVVARSQHELLAPIALRR